MIRHLLRSTPRRRFLGAALGGVVALLGLGSSALRAQSSSELMATLRAPGHVVLMRHSLAPGSGDPASFDLRDCATQRNLDDEGRAQAARAGAILREAGVEVSAVHSGRWCRNLETARLLGLGEVREAPAFDSQMNLGGGRAEEARTLLAELPRDAAAAVIVTHSSNIRGVTGRSAASGEMLVLRLEGGVGFGMLGSLGVL